MGATDRFLKRGRIQDFSRGPIAKMLSELRKFGANGHLYIPGVGAISGITAGNYLDSIGTTNASVDGNVGLVLDGVGSVGAELNPNPEYGGAWVAAGTTPPTANANDTFQGSACRSVTFPAIASGGYSVSRAEGAAFNSVLGTTYRCEYEIATSRPLVSGESIVVVFTGSNAIGMVNLNPANTAAVAFSKYVVPRVASVGGFVSLRPYAGTLLSPVTLYIRKASAKAVAGINALQPTTGYQPKLRQGIVNLLTQSDFQNGLTDAPTRAGLISLSSIDVRNALGVGYDGVTSSYAYKAYSATAGIAYTFACIVKMDDGQAPAFGSSTIQSPLNDFAVKAASNEIIPTTYTVASLGNGAYLVAASASATGAQAGIVKYAGQSSRTFKVTSYSLFQGALTAQQILAAGGIPLTTTAPASGSVGAYRLDFDGTDDFMSLGSVPFQIADDHYTAIALTPNAINTGKHVLNPANGAASQQVGNISVDGNSKYITRWCDDATNVLGVADAVTVAPGVASVLASRRVGTMGVLRKNGAQVGSISLASLGATTLTLPGVIGSYKTGVSPSAISLHGVAVIKGTVTDAQALIFERGLNAIAQYAAGRF